MKNSLVIVLILIAALTLLIACRPSSIINTLTPRGAFDLQKDVSYGTDARQVMDIYTPTADHHKSAIVVFVHGGSWADGDKKDYLFVGQAFSELGYLTVIPNYRLYPQVQFPDFIHDIARALAALERLLPAQPCIGIDPQKIILVGHSAGAHTVAMIATDPQYLHKQKTNVDIQTWIGLAGPYDLPLDSPLVVDKFTTVDNNRDANPLNLATANTPPALLLHGVDDTTVYPEHTRKMTRRLQELGVPVVTHYYAKTNHTRMAGGLAKNLRFLNGAYADIEQYLAERGLDQDCPGQ